MAALKHMLSRRKHFKSLETTARPDHNVLIATFEVGPGINGNPLLIGLQLVDNMPTALHIDCLITDVQSLDASKLTNAANSKLFFGKVIVGETSEVVRYSVTHLFTDPTPNEAVLDVLITEALSAQVSTCIAVARLRKIAKEAESHEEVHRSRFEWN